MQKVNIFVFPSKVTKHIDLGCYHRKWALPPCDVSEERKRIGRAKKMEVGAFGLFYDEPRKALTVPFIIGSDTSEEEVIEGIWPGKWQLPFTILPLGHIGKLLPTNKLRDKLQYLSSTGKRWSDVFRFRGLTVFSPTELPYSDWQSLLRELTP